MKGLVSFNMQRMSSSIVDVNHQKLHKWNIQEEYSALPESIFYIFILTCLTGHKLMLMTLLSLSTPSSTKGVLKYMSEAVISRRGGSGSGGEINGIEYITEVITQNISYAIPNHIGNISVRIFGGGGGGGRGSGGGGGWMNNGEFDILNGTEVSIIIGDGGPGWRSSQTSGSGGTTSFGSYLSANGGRMDGSQGGSGGSGGGGGGLSSSGGIGYQFGGGGGGRFSNGSSSGGDGGIWGGGGGGSSYGGNASNGGNGGTYGGGGGGTSKYGYGGTYGGNGGNGSTNANNGTNTIGWTNVHTIGLLYLTGSGKAGNNSWQYYDNGSNTLIYGKCCGGGGFGGEGGNGFISTWSKGGGGGGGYAGNGGENGGGGGGYGFGADGGSEGGGGGGYFSKGGDGIGGGGGGYGRGGDNSHYAGFGGGGWDNRNRGGQGICIIQYYKPI